jgi:galactokinase
MPSAAGTVTDPARLLEWLATVESRATVHPDAVRMVRAPGRVNLIGEHTDYNDGYVLPAAIDLELRIAYLPTDDHRVELHSDSDGVGAPLVIDLRDIGPPKGEWGDYVRGTALELQRAGLPVYGLRGVLASTVPVGAGLSSSAALELAACWALSGDRPPAADALTLARLSQRAENEYVGVHCGLMDQFASASGTDGAAMLLDCRSLQHRIVPLPTDMVLVVAHSGVPRSLSGSAYNERRAECEAGVAAIARRDPGVRSLRDVTPALLDAHAADLDPVVARRARHVVTENRRVLLAEAALASADATAVGELFAASHASLRDDYEVSCPELDLLVEVAAATPGVVASRMTGAGFGGCTVSLVRPDAVGALNDRILGEYARRSGRGPRVWPVRAVDGAGVLSR